MKISSLIKRFKNIQEKKGDLEIYINDNRSRLNDILVGEDSVNINERIVILI